MADETRTAIVISASSDIGTALTLRWIEYGWNVAGTYRTRSSAVKEMEHKGANLVPCDLTDDASIPSACSALSERHPRWDILVLCAAVQEPIGAFADCSFGEWDEALKVNFTSQMRIIHSMLPSRRVGSGLGPCVLLFAGAGTNSALPNYSAYIASKIALIKMCELLDAEIPDTRFVIIGPGVVKTKIHESTILAGDRAGDNYQRTVERLAVGDHVSMDEVLDCCNWAIDAPREVIGGRNFSLVFDEWGSEQLDAKLAKDSDMYKLRRSGNDWLVKK